MPSLWLLLGFIGLSSSVCTAAETVQVGVILHVEQDELNGLNHATSLKRKIKEMAGQSYDLPYDILASNINQVIHDSSSNRNIYSSTPFVHTSHHAVIQSTNAKELHGRSSYTNASAWVTPRLAEVNAFSNGDSASTGGAVQHLVPVVHGAASGKGIAGPKEIIHRPEEDKAGFAVTAEVDGIFTGSALGGGPTDGFGAVACMALADGASALAHHYTEYEFSFGSKSSPTMPPTKVSTAYAFCKAGKREQATGDAEADTDATVRHGELKRKRDMAVTRSKAGAAASVNLVNVYVQCSGQEQKYPEFPKAKYDIDIHGTVRAGEFTGEMSVHRKFYVEVGCEQYVAAKTFCLCGSWFQSLCW